MPAAAEFKAYLDPSEYIDWNTPAVSAKAAELAQGCRTAERIVERCFHFVRDGIKHSVDYKMNPVTCRASDVLRHGTGYCYAKSHLLAALLRANAIPAGLCYQRLAVGAKGPPFCLHGLNAVYLENYGWYRVDPRGDKPGVETMFCPPVEKLAFPTLGEDEADLPEVWAEPLRVVVNALTQYETYDQVERNLPDIVLIGRRSA